MTGGNLEQGAGAWGEGLRPGGLGPGGFRGPEPVGLGPGGSSGLEPGDGAQMRAYRPGSLPKKNCHAAKNLI